MTELPDVQRPTSEHGQRAFGQRRSGIGNRALLIAVTVAACGGPNLEEIRITDLREVADALQRNISAIQRRDTEAYLRQYLDSPDLTIVTPDSLVRGYLLFSEWRRASDEWPDTLIADRPRLMWIGPGVVWAAFQYTAVIAGDTLRGVSERLFSKTGNGWKILVTGTNEGCPISGARCP